MTKVTQEASGGFAVQFLAVVVLALLGDVSVGDYADDVCKSKSNGIVFGLANVTSTDGVVLLMRYECYVRTLAAIDSCAFATSPDAKVKAKSTDVIIADIGSRFYVVSCNRFEKPAIKPAEIAKFCNDDTVEKEETLESTDKQAASGPPGSKEVVYAVKVSDAEISVNVSYNISCFDNHGVISCSFAGGNRLRSHVTVAQGSSGYIVQDGSDYSLRCNKLYPARIKGVSKSYADELCKEVVSAAWDQTVTSDFSTYPTGDQLILKKEETLTIYSASVPIAYEVQCFGEPVQIQQCSYAGGGRLKDSFTIPPGSNGANIRQGANEFTLKCGKFTKAKISVTEKTGADDFCENALKLKEKERQAAKGSAFSLKEDEVTTKVLSLERPALIGPKIKVEVKALCFGNRPMFQSCQMIRKSNNEVVSAGKWGSCIELGIGPMKTMTKLNCDELDMPQFTKNAKRCT